MFAIRSTHLRRCPGMRRPASGLRTLALPLVITLLAAACHDPSSPASRATPAPRGEVSTVPPDDIPAGLAASSNIVTNPPRYPYEFIRDVVLVRFQPTATAADRTAALASVNGTVIGGIRITATDGYYIVGLAADPTNNGPLDAVELLSRNSAVRHAMIDYVWPSPVAFLRPNDGQGWQKSAWSLAPDSAWGKSAQRSTWSLEADNAPWAWGCSIGNANTNVTVIDMGLRDVADLHDNIAASSQLWTSGTFDHGTRVASVLAASGDNGIGMTGMMWRAGLRLYDVSTRDSATGEPVLNASGLPVLEQHQLIEALAQSIASRARVINISLGISRGGSAAPTAADSLAIGDLKKLFGALPDDAGGNPPLIVVAAGNNGAAPMHDARWSLFPVIADTLPNITLVVGAADTVRGQTATFSSDGSLVSIAAPGVSIGVLKWSGADTVSNGTSFAAPQVAGAAGLTFAFDSSLTAAQVKTLLLQGAQDGGNIAGSWPMLDVYRALKRAANRPGAPLCGNRVWVSDDDKLTVSRGSGTEIIATLPPNGVNGTYNAYVNAKHGGRRIEVNGYAVEYSSTTRSWPHVTTSDYANLDNGMYSSVNGTAHDGDAYAWSDISYDPATKSRVVAMSYQAPDGNTRPIATLKIPLTSAPQVCVTQTISTGQCTQYAPEGSFTDAAYVAPYPAFTGDGEAVLLPIDRLQGTATVGEWVLQPDNDTEKRTSRATVQVVRTDVYRIPISGPIPADLVDRPVWSLSGRDIYWIAGSEDDREFGAGSFVYTDLTSTPPDCKNEYRSNTADASRSFGTFLSQPGTGTGPSGENCWGDEKAAIAADRLLPAARLTPSLGRIAGRGVRGVPSATAAPSGSPLASLLRLSTGRRRMPPALAAQIARRQVRASRGYQFPDGLWEIGPGGRLQLTPLGVQRYRRGVRPITR